MAKAKRVPHPEERGIAIRRPVDVRPAPMHLTVEESNLAALMCQWGARMLMDLPDYGQGLVAGVAAMSTAKQLNDLATRFIENTASVVAEGRQTTMLDTEAP